MSKKAALRSFVTVALLSLGVFFVYGPQLVPQLRGQDAVAAERAYVVDLDYWTRTERERVVQATAHLDLDHDLRAVPLTVGDWRGEEVEEKNKEVMILLQPEQYVLRLYQNSAGEYLWLSMIGGRSSRPFHPPDICYDADGWQYNLGSHATTLPQGGEIYGLYLDATKEVAGEVSPWQHVVYYFYLFPDDGRDQNDGIVLFKLTAPKYGSVEDTLALLEDFTRNFFSMATPPHEAPATTTTAFAAARYEQ
jgi:hypothetical protein